MIRVLLDACLPHWLRKDLPGLDVETARYAGLDHLSDTELLTVIDGRFDVLVTLDRNLTYQQKIAGRTFAVVVMRVSEQTPKAFRSVLPQLNSAIANCSAGQVKIVGP